MIKEPLSQRFNLIVNQRYRVFCCGAEEGLNEPFLRLLMLVKAVNEENVLVKAVEDEIEI
ncbi:hypothetical protein PBAL39_14464 [Pedobacter sp. BAL39]|uniref:hypothetical protein n=1 Tax=Pedobacter sp. BAL39 TaxID=391596 RepID=UPI00015593A7|nr:hypothetical protein [Pedobacter sp. BAL39]EDM37636.1 hypothetical protein PBAL39_14464 [Pedobacter sp. BAL39]